MLQAEKQSLGDLLMNKSIVPNTFTATNLALGVIGITFSSQGYFFGAAVCILLSLLADAFDGRTARALGVAGPFGRELDSLADVISFGVSPAFMMYSAFLTNLGWIGYIPLLAYSVLGAFRLARFNIMTEEVKGYFMGLAIPTAGCLCATYVLSGVSAPVEVIVIGMLVVSYLMVSKVKYPEFKGHDALPISKIAIAIVVVLLIALLLWDWRMWIVLPFLGYTVFGIINALIAK